MRTILRIISVLMLILGILLLGITAMDIGVILQAGGPQVLTGALIGLTVVLVALNGLFEVVGGILGLRAAKRPGGSTAAVVFGVLALASGVFSLVTDFSTPNLCACILPALYLICAIGIRASRH